MRLGGAKRLALRPAADRPRDVQGGCGLRPAREDEALELGKLGVEAVAVLLEPVDERLLDPQAPLDLARDGEVGADVEELVLDALERLARSSSRSSPASTTPSAAFSSSTAPNATMRASSFETRDPSPSDVSPASPPRV